jgi:putative flippase GtrA
VTHKPSDEPFDGWLPSVSGTHGTALDRALLDWEGRRYLAGAGGAGSCTLSRSPVRVYAGVRHGATANDRARHAVDELERLGGLDARLLVVGSPTGTGYVNTAALTAAELLTDGDCASVAVQFGAARSQDSSGSFDAAVASLTALLEQLATRARAGRTVLWAESYGCWVLLEAIARAGPELVDRAVDAVVAVGVPGPALADPRLRSRLDELREPSVVYIHDDDPVAHVPGASIAVRPQRHQLPVGEDGTPPPRMFRRGWLPLITALQVRRTIERETRPGAPGELRRPHDYRHAALDLVARASSIEPVDRQQLLDGVRAAELHAHEVLLNIAPEPVLRDPWRPIERDARSDAGQPLRFLVVGAGGYGANLAIFALLINVTPYAPAATASYLTSNALMFLGNRYWTFARRGPGLAREYLRYLLVGLVVLAGNVALLALLVEAIGVRAIIAQAISLLLMTPAAFALNKRWTFQEPHA